MANLKITLDSGKSLELRKPKFKDLERANTLSVDESRKQERDIYGWSLVKTINFIS